MLIPPPYPPPAQQWWRVLQIIGWSAGIVMGAWVLINPPNSYEKLGSTLTLVWGAMMCVGSLIVLAGHLTRRYRIEVPGLFLAAGGVVIYCYLSWVAAFTYSPGSGPRALALTLLACQIAARIVYLLHADREAQKAAQLVEEVGPYE